jgi:hypothetical protein
MKIGLRAVVALLLASNMSAVWGVEEAQVRQLLDRIEIQELMARYTRALDTLDAAAYASVYAEDGRLVAGGPIPTTVGRAALRKLIEDLKTTVGERRDSAERIYHVSTNWHLEFVGDNDARLRAYWMEVIGGVEAGGGKPRVIAAGGEVNDFVRVDGQWLIKSRDVTVRD